RFRPDLLRVNLQHIPDNFLQLLKFHLKCKRSFYSVPRLARIFSLICCSLKVTHWIMELCTSRRLELPWVFTTRPFSPKRGAPPYWLASKDFKVLFSAGFTRRAPILLRKSLIMPFLTMPSKVAPTPSYSFKITFPTKASQTITSAPPWGISLASMLPIKLMSGHSF